MRSLYQRVRTRPGSFLQKRTSSLAVPTLYCSPVSEQPVVPLERDSFPRKDDVVEWLEDLARNRRVVLRVDNKPFDSSTIEVTWHGY